MKVIIIKKSRVLIVFIVLISILLYSFKSKQDIETIVLPVTNKVIVIDPGHGGVDPGAVGDDGIHEKDVNLEISLKLRRLLEQSGSTVVLTRDEDVGLYTEKSTTYRAKKNEDLRNRRIMVNEINPDLFLTVHINAFPQSRYYGAQTFYQGDNEESKKLARIIQEEFRNVLDKDNHRVSQKGSAYLLKEVNSTSVLIECGFFSNENEEKLLKNSKYQEKIAWAIYVAVVRYFNEGEGGID